MRAEHFTSSRECTLRITKYQLRSGLNTNSRIKFPINLVLTRIIKFCLTVHSTRQATRRNITLKFFTSLLAKTFSNDFTEKSCIGPPPPTLSKLHLNLFCCNFPFKTKIICSEQANFLQNKDPPPPQSTALTSKLLYSLLSERTLRSHDLPPHLPICSKSHF